MILDDTVVVVILLIPINIRNTNSSFEVWP